MSAEFTESLKTNNYKKQIEMQQIIWQEIYVLQVLQWKEYNKHLKFNIIFYKDLYANKWTRL